MLTTLILCVFLTAQLTYLVVDSVILDRPRGWITERRDFYVLSCPWCLSAWVAAALVAFNGLPVLSWGAVWWGGVAAYFVGQWLATKPYS
ncbi:MAG TPA: hypothetical protein PLP55_14120 [Phycicoccus elongatus]|uniref:hypothetical protein n=1 Tax=Phycicoccus elongatus TaxID=101689 RepID=UPI002BF5136F|nr:hypothetical protein [Phycicoccus elongatus]HPK13796.1 hypothetical protein [Phycicoccus elongatus]